jgi:DNA-binding transcriptional LysR family regulator
MTLSHAATKSLTNFSRASLLPYTAARHNTPQCAYVPLAEYALERQIVALWRRGTAHLPAAREFVELVREVVRGW